MSSSEPIADLMNRPRLHAAPAGERRNDGVHSGTIGKTRVEHRRALVDPASDAGSDPSDDLHQVRRIAEAHLRLGKNALSLDVDPAWPVHEDVDDQRIPHELFDRPETEDLVHHFPDELLLFHRRERDLVLVQ
jgi:hypothetical protein